MKNSELKELKKIPVASLKRDESQPRKYFDEKVIASLAENLKANGQQVPLLVCGDLIIDGECRWRAMQLAGIPEADCIVFENMPSPAQLAVCRLSIDVNRTNHRPMERAGALQDLMKQTGWTLSEACRQTGISQSLGSKLTSLNRLAPELQRRVDEGWDIERAYLVSQVPDQAKQLEMAKEIGSLNREQLRTRTRRKAASPSSGVTTPIARFAMPGGLTVSVQGPDVSLGLAIEVLSEAVKQLRKCAGQGLSLDSVIKCMRDTAKKAGPFLN
jgi:ParB family chromosome partitioning protein